MTLRKRFLLACVLCSVALLGHKPVNATQARDTLIVVAGKSFPANNISFAALKSAFRGQHVQLAGKVLVPINHPENSPARVSFDRTVLRLEPADVGSFWIDMRIRDQGRPPKTASSPELALGVVTALPGAITYATKSTLVDKWPLKVLTVDEKSAGQAGYPLTR